MLYRVCGADETTDVVHIDGRTLKHRIVNSAKEQRSAKGWSETPANALKRKRWRHWAQVTLKPLWEKWEWAIKLLAAVLIIVAATLKLLPEPAKLENIPKPQPANSDK